jgi:hypothetical protein
MRHLAKLALIAGAFTVACGDSNDGGGVGPTAAPPPSDIVVDLSRDVRDNLSLHYLPAAKPPAKAAEIHFDFHETARAARDGRGVVTGDFIYRALGVPTRKGSIDIFYRPGNGVWLRTGLFEVTDGTQVQSAVFSLTVRDASTTAPLLGVDVEARRVDDVRSSAGTTDILGQAQLEVLPGVFQITVRREDYVPFTTERLTTVEGVLQLSDLRLQPLNPKVSRF